MAKSEGIAKKTEKMVTKVGRSWVKAKATVVEWMVGPSPGVSRAPIDWKMEVFKATKIVAYNYV